MRVRPILLQVIPGRRTVHFACRELSTETKAKEMLRYAVVPLVIALIAALFGFTGIAAGAVEIGKILFFVFLLLFVVSPLVGLMRRK